MATLPQTNATGRGDAKATTTRPKLKALLGIWLIVWLQFALIAFGITMILSNIMPAPGVDWFWTEYGNPPINFPVDGQLEVEFVSLLIALGLVVLNLVILWKGTRWFYSGRRAARRRRLGLCEQCGYDLRGTVAADRDSCPECGTTITPGKPTGEATAEPCAGLGAALPANANGSAAGGPP